MFFGFRDRGLGCRAIGFRVEDPEFRVSALQGG